MEMGFFYTAVLGNFTSKKIRAVSGGQYSHVGPYYRINDHDEYFESWMKKDENGKDGMRGPLPLEDLVAWSMESPNHVLYIQDPLPMTDEEVEASYLRMMQAVEDISYAHMQLFWNWVSAKTGFVWYRRTGSRKKWTCCESCVHAVDAGYWPFMGFPYIIADDTFPSGLNGIKESAEHILGSQ